MNGVRKQGEDLWGSMGAGTKMEVWEGAEGCGRAMEGGSGDAEGALEAAGRLRVVVGVLWSGPPTRPPPPLPQAPRR